MKRLCIILFLIIFMILPLESKTLWKDINIYTSGAGLNIGDILVVDIEDISKLKFSMAMNDEKSFNISTSPDSNITAFLPKVTSNKNIRSKGNSTYSGDRNINVQIATRIIQKNNDGTLKITGRQEYVFNGITNKFQLSGVIDPTLVKGRTVMSKHIADFKLDIRGLTEKGIVSIDRPAVKEGESASVNLNENEKQKLIIDYLNKMIRELTR